MRQEFNKLRSLHLRNEICARKILETPIYASYVAVNSTVYMMSSIKSQVCSCNLRLNFILEAKLAIEASHPRMILPTFNVDCKKQFLLI